MISYLVLLKYKTRNAVGVRLHETYTVHLIKKISKHFQVVNVGKNQSLILKNTHSKLITEHSDSCM